MKVFISWSGPRSKILAEALKDWIPKIIQVIEPWFSADIDKGRRWDGEIAAQLEESRIGIICLTRDNLDSPWINFEAGALSKTRDAYVCTLLLDVEPSNIEPPLGTFQHTSVSQEDIYKLLQTINNVVSAAGEKSPSASDLEELSRTFWPKLSEKIDQAKATKILKPAAPRTGDEIMREILETVRRQERRQLDHERRTSEMVQAADYLAAADFTAAHPEAAARFANAIKNNILAGQPDSDIINKLLVAGLPLPWIKDAIDKAKEQLGAKLLKTPKYPSKSPSLESATLDPDPFDGDPFAD